MVIGGNVMLKLLVIAKMLCFTLGLTPAEWACYESVAEYQPREQYTRACVYAEDMDETTPNLVIYETWNGEIGMMFFAG